MPMNLIAPLCRRNVLSNLVQQGFYPKRCNKRRRPDISHPAFWYEDYPISLIGRRQSPINIATEHCVRNNQHMTLSPELLLQYPPSFSGLKIRNPNDQTYFGWRVDVPYSLGDSTVLKGGPLHHRYKLIQFHAHWGKDCVCGSEHIINGKHYSAELHFVHWNSELYPSARQAAISKDGLAVVAVFLEATDDEKCPKLDSLETLSTLMNDIKYKGATRDIKQSMDILELIPKKRSYWTYLGSLTTPPLWETVTWIIFEETVKCRTDQIDSFRSISYYPYDEIKELEDEYEVNVEENSRPIQPLNGRKVIYVKG